jgi:hypothetical protein
MISEENLIQLSSVRDRWITEIRSANITTDANPGTTILQPPIVAALDPRAAPRWRLDCRVVQSKPTQAIKSDNKINQTIK